MNFWSRTSSKTFNRYSEFHASKEAIIRRLTTLAVMWHWPLHAAVIAFEVREHNS